MKGSSIYAIVVLLVFMFGLLVGLVWKEIIHPDLWRVIKIQPEFSRAALEDPAKKDRVIWVGDISGRCLATMVDGVTFYYGKSYGSEDCLWIKVNSVPQFEEPVKVDLNSVMGARPVQ